MSITICTIKDRDTMKKGFAQLEKNDIACDVE